MYVKSTGFWISILDKTKYLELNIRYNSWKHCYSNKPWWLSLYKNILRPDINNDLLFKKKSTVTNTRVTWYPRQRGTNSIASTDPMGIFNYFFRGNGTWKNGKKCCCILKRLCHLIISEYWPPISKRLGIWFCQTLRAWFKSNDCLEESQSMQGWALQWTDFTHTSTKTPSISMVLQPHENHKQSLKQVYLTSTKKKSKSSAHALL